MVDKKDILEDGNPNCVWKNITFKKVFDTAQDAKDFLHKNFDNICSTYKIHIEA